MHPLRIVLLVVLFYILFRLIIGSVRRSAGKASSPRGAGSGRDQSAQDVLMPDPVCGTLIPTRSAFTLKKDGKTLYFCSEGCRRQFTTKQGESR